MRLIELDADRDWAYYTDCPECRDTERTMAQRWFDRAFKALNRPNPAAEMMSGYAAVMRASLGVQESTWYDKHREAWATTGDLVELRRMLRHVT